MNQTAELGVLLAQCALCSYSLEAGQDLLARRTHGKRRNVFLRVKDMVQIFAVARRGG
jgi:hypothetical protein